MCHLTTYPGKRRRVRVIKCFPHFLFYRLPGVPCASRGDPASFVANFTPTTTRNFNISRTAVDFVEVRILIFISGKSLQLFFGVTMFIVFCPAACLYLLLIQAPKVKLFFKERSAHISWTVKFSRAVEIQNMREHRGVPIEEKLAFLSERSRVLHGSLSYPRQACVRNTCQCADKCLVFLPANV